MKKLRPIFAILLMLPLVTGCSVGMALSGKKDPNLSVVKKGASRSEVELQLGAPKKTATGPNGESVAHYEYETGNEPSPGRAVAHGAMDVLTFGLWEVVGTPVEVINGNKHKLVVTYNQEDTVTRVQAHG